MSGYDPFTRGPFPVGVRTVVLARGGRALPVELWYPATDEYAGSDVAESTRDTYQLIPGFPLVWQEAVRDATARPGRHALVVFSHGYGGHRRQSTFLCAHLASHGYVVAAVDHTGNTMLEVVQGVLILGAGGRLPHPDTVLREFVDLRWDREVPTLYVVAGRDSLLPLAGMHELFEQTLGVKRMVVVEDADHLHFCDRVEETHELFRMMPQDPLFEDVQKAIPPIQDLIPGERAHLAIRGLAVAHMDAHLRGDEAAARLLAGDVRATLGERGVAATVV